MRIENKPIFDLVPYQRNAKTHDKKQIDNVAQSIAEFGMVQPIVVDKDNNIIIGHCGALACKKLKIKEVPVVKLEDLTPEEANKLRLLDNKLNESPWDFDLLADDVPELDFSAYDIDWQLPEIIEEGADVIEDDVPDNVETRCKPNPMPSLSKRHWTWNTELICYATRGKHTFNFPKEGHALSTWTINKKNGDTGHPTEKPVEVPAMAVSHSSKENDVVLDLFGGSGSTLIACEQLNRKCYMAELDERYVSVIVNRWLNFTGRKDEIFCIRDGQKLTYDEVFN